MLYQKNLRIGRRHSSSNKTNHEWKRCKLSRLFVACAAPKLVLKLAMNLTAAPPTKKLYLQDTYLLTCISTLLAIEDASTDAPAAVVLNQTVFHPQGGGQPSDVGTLTGEGFLFEVSAVKQVMYLVEVESNRSTPFILVDSD
jgi:alanyl-tRNA synthetase